MSTHVPWPPSGFDDLSPDEKVDYVQSLWDRIAAIDDRVPVPEWHTAMIRQRLADLGSDSEDLRDWTQVREQMARDLQRSKSNS